MSVAPAARPFAPAASEALMQRQRRLTRTTRISQIHRQGRSVANGLLVFRLLPNDMERSRFCIVAGKRVGNAVVRNRVKRRLREAVRNTPHHPGWDAIIMARRGSGAADYHRLQRAVRNLMRRTGMAAPLTGKGVATDVETAQ